MDLAVNITFSQIAVRVRTEGPVDLATLRNSMQAFIGSFVDALGWVRCCGWRVVFVVIGYYFGAKQGSVSKEEDH